MDAGTDALAQGPLPTELGLLTNLHRLQLSDNKLTGILLTVAVGLTL